MLKKSKEQYDSGSIIMDHKVFIPLNPKRYEYANQFIEECVNELRIQLRLFLGYVMEDNKWVKSKNIEL